MPVENESNEPGGSCRSGNHVYPDGFVLFCGIPFAPTKDRDATGEGFMHRLGGMATSKAPELGVLSNEVTHSPNCRRLEFPASQLMPNLAGRGLPQANSRSKRSTSDFWCGRSDESVL